MFGCEFLNLLLSGSGTIQNGSGFRSKFENPACKTLFYVVRIRIRKIRIRITSTFSYNETRSLDILLSKLNFKPKSFKHSKSSVLARVRGCVRACAVACACARLRARVHGCARACVRARVLACVRRCVLACVRPSKFTKPYRNVAQHALQHF